MSKMVVTYEQYRQLDQNKMMVVRECDHCGERGMGTAKCPECGLQTSSKLYYDGVRLIIRG